MSWVAELKAMSQKNARVYWKNRTVGIVKAMHAKEAPTRSSVNKIQ